MVNKFTRVLTKDIERRMVLDGVKVAEVEAHDNDSVRSVTLEDKKGNRVKVVYNGYSSLYLMAPKEPEYEEKWVLSGKYKGLEVHEVFDHEHQAQSRREELDDSLSIEKEQVEVA